MTTLTTLLPALQRAEQGSTRLDLLISYIVDGASSDDLRRIELFSAEGYVPERVAALLGHVPQPYTTRLDAAVPGENIVLSMYSAGKGRWAAIHRDPSGAEELHWGATEALARRIAALHAIVAKNGAVAAVPTGARESFAGADVNGAAGQQPAVTDEGVPTPWKILF